MGGVVITIYNAIPSKNLRCQDALLAVQKPEPMPVETSLEGGGQAFKRSPTVERQGRHQIFTGGVYCMAGDRRMVEEVARETH